MFLSAFIVEAEAQTLKPSMRKDGTKSSIEAVGSTRKKRYVVQAEKNDNGICSIKKLEAY